MELTVGLRVTMHHVLICGFMLSLIIASATGANTTSPTTTSTTTSRLSVVSTSAARATTNSAALTTRQPIPSNTTAQVNATTSAVSTIRQTADLSVKPINQVVTVGSPVSFQCQPTRQSDGIYWVFYSIRSPDSYCAIYITNYNPMTMNLCPNASRYRVSDVFTLTINETSFDDVGTYACVNLNSTSTPASAFLGVIDGPRVSTDKQWCLTETNLSCSVKYTGYSVIPLQLVLRSPDGVPLLNTSIGYNVQSVSLSVLPSSSKFGPYSCEVRFDDIPIFATIYPRGITPPSGVSSYLTPAQATNAPNFTATSQSAVYRVQFCPRNVSILQLNPTSATCTTDAYPEPRYVWTNSNGSQIGEGQTLTMQIDEFVTCTASTNVTDCYGNVSQCSMSASRHIRNAGPSPTVTMNSTTGPPVIVNIQPTTHFISGGTTVYLTGFNLRSVRTAQLVVTMIYRHISGGQVVKDYQNFTSEPCDLNNDTQITCTVPLIKLPEEYRYLNDSNVTFPFNPKNKRKRSLTETDNGVFMSMADREPADKVGSLQRYIDDLLATVFTRRQKRALTAVASYSDHNSSLDFTWEVIINGLIYPWNLSNTIQFITTKPELNFSSQVQNFNPSKPSVITIQGRHLTRGVTAARDYTVVIGTGQCESKELTDNILYCQPQHKEPGRTDFDKLFCQHDFVLVVKIGGNSITLGNAGCLKYVDDVSAMIAIIVCSVGGSLIIILVIAIGVFIYHRRLRPNGNDYVESDKEVRPQPVPVQNRRSTPVLPQSKRSGYTRTISDVHIEYANPSFQPYEEQSDLAGSDSDINPPFGQSRTGLNRAFSDGRSDEYPNPSYNLYRR